MKTPIWDFVTSYAQNGPARFHMPGHKGASFLGCEPYDITEVAGADALYEADGIIAESETNATQLFGTGRTVYSAEGSSQCIRAMLYLALNHRPQGTAPLILAARNAHKAFVFAAALLDFSVEWLWPEGDSRSLCGCRITAASLEQTLNRLPQPPAAVYITSPDYLGDVADVAALAAVCHAHGTRLLVDNAHGAYLKFLQPSQHPMDLGADLCCDSAHKTLPVLTGGAYLHMSKDTPTALREDVKAAMALFGSTSPSYLILSSLDLCNAYLAEDFPRRLAETAQRLAQVRQTLTANGWGVEHTDPLRLTISATCTQSGSQLAQLLRENGIECEYADPEFLVLMLTPENDPADLDRLIQILGKAPALPCQRISLPVARGEQVCSIREALFAPHQAIPASEALGRICGAPTVACPPAIPIAVSGERIGEDALALFAHYGVTTVDVLR